MATKKVSPGKSKSKLDPGLLRAHKAYEAAINSNETDRVMAMYDKDAEILQPDGPLVTGRGNIRKWVNDYFTAMQNSLEESAAEEFCHGRVWVRRGDRYRRRYFEKGREPITRWDCKGILIYKRQKNGEWLIFRDIWNNNK